MEPMTGRSGGAAGMHIVVGSTRPGRAAEVFPARLVDRPKRHGRFAVRLLDLRDWDLPMFAEPRGAGGRAVTTRPSSAGTNTGRRDAYLLRLPEYNHSVPVSSKNGRHYALGARLRNKPPVREYSGAIGGARAVEHMAGSRGAGDGAAAQRRPPRPGRPRFDDGGLPVDR